MAPAVAARTGGETGATGSRLRWREGPMRLVARGAACRRGLAWLVAVVLCLGPALAGVLAQDAGVGGPASIASGGEAVLSARPTRLRSGLAGRAGRRQRAGGDRRRRSWPRTARPGSRSSPRVRVGTSPPGTSAAQRQRSHCPRRRRDRLLLRLTPHRTRPPRLRPVSRPRRPPTPTCAPRRARTRTSCSCCRPARLLGQRRAGKRVRAGDG